MHSKGIPVECSWRRWMCCWRRTIAPTTVCDPAKLTPRGVRGAPDWVMEVISPASASHDQTVKLAAYERAGVREYWLAHPGDRVLTIYRHDGTTYGRPKIMELAGETASEVLPGVTVRWEPVLARLLPQS